MDITAPGKLILLAIALVGLFILLAIGSIDWSQGGVPIGLIVGYGVGNGVGAKRGQTTIGVFSPKPDYTPQHAAPEEPAA